MNVFERYLSLWVAACMVLGVAIGKLAPGLVGAIREMEFGTGSHINIPIAILIWLMIYPRWRSTTSSCWSRSRRW